MEKKPLVSIILTTKNEEKNIARFLESLKKQTYNNIEIVVVDNNSRDKTKEIAKKYTTKVYDKGPERSAQRNYGAKKSKGKYLVFLDADMELSTKVIADCVFTVNKTKAKVLTIPEKTIGKSLIANIRKFEREMYMGEPEYEVPRFFERELFFEFEGYDENLTGPEDYDLPYRISKKYQIKRSKEYLFHHEEELTLNKLLGKKFYYAKKGAGYALKHPKMIKIQGTILFRKIYLKNWKKFIGNPFLGISFIFVKLLETIWAISGFICAVGLFGFLKTFIKIFIK